MTWNFAGGKKVRQRAEAESIQQYNKIEEKKQEKLDELSALRFKQFAAAFNSKFNKEVAKDK